MAYTISAITPVLGGQLLRVEFSEDGGPTKRAFYTPAELKRKTEPLSFDSYFPLWLRAQAAANSVDLKSVTLAALRTFCIGKTLPALSTREAAEAADGA